MTAGVTVFAISVLIFLAIFYFFRDQVQQGWDSMMKMFSSMGESSHSTDHSSSEIHTEVTHPSPQQGEAGEPPSPSPSPSVIQMVENVLPGGDEVFNISSNKYTYYDAEPLCKALGAELATYDQVKEAWEKGADWCNYGWVKGQMAVYPTSDDTYQKLQSGPEDQRMACGRPGLNGGYFDNPELRFGANCFGKKPPQGKHDERAAAQATPVSPDALAFDKKVAHFKSEADSIGILPFNKNRWD